MEKKVLKHVEMRWISLCEVVVKVLEEYKSLVRFMWQNRKQVDKGKGFLYQLTYLEILLTLVRILSMMDELNCLIKVSQQRNFILQTFLE